MGILWKDMLKKIEKHNKTNDVERDVEEEFNLLKENIVYAQSLARIGSWTYDIKKEETFWTEEIYNILDCTPKELSCKIENFLLYVHYNDKQKVKDIMDAAFKGEGYDIDYRIVTPKGVEKHINEKVQILLDKDRNPIKLIGTIQDISRIKKLEDKLEKGQETINEIEKRFQVLVQDSNDVFEIVTPDGTIEYVSPAIEKILGYKTEERIGKKTFELFQGNEKLRFLQMLKLVLENPKEKVQGNFITNTKDGKEIYIDVVMSNKLSEPAIRGIVVNWRDNTKQRKTQETLEYIATHDELTKLPNDILLRKHIEDLCGLAKEKDTIFAVIMLDINNFKYINDSLGYKLGDGVVIETTKRLKAFLNEKEFIYRYSEDHIAVIIQDLNTIKDYEEYAKSIIEIFYKPYKLGKYELDIIVNMGGSVYPKDAEDAESLIKYANIALLRGKKEGKNRVKFYSSNMEIQNYKELTLRNNLRNSIDKNQLKVYYQPEVNLKTHEILGAEALVRWEHPEWGILFPDEFIPIAEESDFIITLGNWMLREVCKNYKKWLDKGIQPAKVSINYSSIQFLENNFINNIKNIIEEYGLEPSFLTMEITESVLMTNVKKAISSIKNIQELGIQVALDDFGTGFSSLAYLNTFNIDILKIDRSFIKNAAIDQTSSIITSSIISMARQLSIKVVAEGVETWEQLSYLRKQNCYSGQGYLYSKPIPLKEFEKILIMKRCKPKVANNAQIKPQKERRKFFRIQFYEYLESTLTILEIAGKKTNLGHTKVLIKNMGPGGLCFISNIRFPVKRNVILQFITELLDEEIIVYGCPVWTGEIDDNLYEYGVEFTFDENKRVDLIRILNQVQIRMKNNIGFADGSFISETPVLYFKEDRLKKSE